MRKTSGILLLLVLVLLFSSCRTINSKRTSLGITQKTVYLSFDDGPDAEVTPELLDVLKKYNVKAIFCLLGVNCRRYPDLVRRIHNEGHFIINHGYSDKFAVQMGNEEFRNNLIMGEKAISLALGFDTEIKLYRPQGGFYNSHHERIWKEEGFIMLPVTVRAHDAVSTSAEQNRVVKKIVHRIMRKNGGLILLHDARESYVRKDTILEKKPKSSFNRSWIPRTVEEIIKELMEKGFVISDPDTYIHKLVNEARDG